MDLYTEDDGREKLISFIETVLDKKVEYGLVLVMLPDQTMDFGHNVTTSQIRTALLSYCRDLATYIGD